MQPVERDRLIQEYFERGHSYRLILCFLFALHGGNISLRTLKRHLQRLNLRRRGRHTSLSRVTRCLLVRISISARCIVACLCSYRLSCMVRGHSLDTGQCIRDCVADITLLFQGEKKCWSLNPRRACAAKVTVVVCQCVSVWLKKSHVRACIDSRMLSTSVASPRASDPQRATSVETTHTLGSPPIDN